MCGLRPSAVGSVAVLPPDGWVLPLALAAVAVAAVVLIRWRLSARRQDDVAAEPASAADASAADVSAPDVSAPDASAPDASAADVSSAIDAPRSVPLPDLLFPEDRPAPDWMVVLVHGTGRGPQLARATLLLLLGFAFAAGGFAASPFFTRDEKLDSELWAGANGRPSAAPASLFGVDALADSTASNAVDRLFMADRRGRLVGTAVPAAVDSATGERLILWDGNGQEGRAGRLLETPLMVILRDSADRPLHGREVRFRVAAGGGRVEPRSTRTSRSGLAVARWWPGPRADSLAVTATVADRPELRVEFRARLGSAASPAVREPPAAVAVSGSAAADRSSPERSDASGGATADRAGSGGSAGDRSDPAPAPPERPAPPVRPAPGASVLSVGGVQTCRLLEGQVAACWGGPGPVRHEALRLVAAGLLTTCGVSGTSTVTCWEVRNDAREPVAPVHLPGESPIVDLAVGSEHVCALVAGGTVYCWGANNRGQLGNGSLTESAVPVQVIGLPPAAQLSAGWLHTCALTARSTAYCWGANGAGQLGDGSTMDRTHATAVARPSHFVRLASGSKHTCGLSAAGTVWCWGDNDHGQLGTGADAGSSQPVRVRGDGVFASVTAGSVHTCGLTEGGRAWCWGRNTFGQLGNGSIAASPEPTPIRADLRFRALIAGGAHTCGDVGDGQLFCWGNNTHGQLGDGTRDHRSSPTPASQDGS